MYRSSWLLLCTKNLSPPRPASLHTHLVVRRIRLYSNFLESKIRLYSNFWWTIPHLNSDRIPNFAIILLMSMINQIYNSHIPLSELKFISNLVRYGLKRWSWRQRVLCGYLFSKQPYRRWPGRRRRPR